VAPDGGLAGNSACLLSHTERQPTTRVPRSLARSMQNRGELASQVKGFVPAGTVVCEVQEKDQDFKSSTSHDVRLEVSFTEEGIQAHRNRYIREFEASHTGWTRGVWSKDSMMLTWYRLDKDCPVTYVTTPAGRSEQGLCASLRITFHGKGGPIPPGASILVSSSKNK